jgi:hypothetical protein
MAERRRRPERQHVIAFESYGVRVSVEAVSQKQLDIVRGILPPGWQPCDPEDSTEHFSIEDDPLGRWLLLRDGRRVMKAGIEFPHLLLYLDAQIRAYIAARSPDLIFVHAGVVSIGERLLVAPGRSFAGKTTLVAALVREGAHYYSDEYAPIDADGLVHPYPRPLSLRHNDFSREPIPVQELGGVAGEQPRRITDIVVTTYKPKAEWKPRELTAGESALALLSNTVPAQTRPEQTMRHLRQAVEGARAVEGPRPDSAAFAKMLLEQLTA